MVSALGSYEGLYSDDAIQPSLPKVEHDIAAVDTTIRHVGLVDTTEMHRKRGEHPITIETSELDKARKDKGGGRFTDHALQIVRIVTPENECRQIELRIHSPIIQQSLRQILFQSTDAKIYEDPIVFVKPFKTLFYNQQRIRDYQNDPNRTTEEVRHLKALTEEFHLLYMSDIEKQWAVFEKTHFISFDMLWTLFKQEAEVLVREDGYDEVKRVQTCYMSYNEENFVVSLWSWGYAGGTFGPFLYSVEIPSYQGSMLVESLKCYPLELCPDAAEIREKLTKRGHKWRSLIAPAQQQYSGPVWITWRPRLEHKWSQKPGELPRQYIDGRIMVDTDTHIREYPELTTRLRRSRIFSGNRAANVIGEADKHSEDTILGQGDISQSRKTPLQLIGCFPEHGGYDMTDEQALLSPARSQGFVLRLGRWGYFLVDCIQPVTYDREAFDALELDDGKKHLIRTLVTNRFNNKEFFTDCISGKGKGLIFCLEGSPGSGKTLTAESIAELEEKPLYSLSTSDLGTDSSLAEQKLQAAFDRAVRWRAILLIDEADLYMTKRTSQEMHHNAFVIIFLRLVEYYEGVLFLTTNRIDEFDPAFESRIHFKTSIPEPSKKLRKHIWRRFISQLPHKPGTFSWTDADFDAVSDFPLNGREIRNLLSLSLSVAGGTGLDPTTVQRMYEAAFAERKSQAKEGCTAAS